MAECLRALEVQFGISNYRYIGLGANTFVDFILFHRELRIDDMTSIERDNAQRAAFNTPYACIDVQHGESTVVLPELDLQRKRALVWMDYDDPLVGGTAIDDIYILGASVPSGSIVMVSANAQNNQLDDDEVRRSAPEVKPDARLRILRELFSDYLPAELPANPTGARTFGGVVAAILFNCVAHAVARAGRTDVGVPLFSFYYNDGAAMVTIAVMIADEADQRRLHDANLSRFDYVRGRDQIVIDVPPLTYREKGALDRLLPTEGLTPQALRAAHNFEIVPSQLEAYARYYRHYPIYSELFSY
jgi:hypothetical protein